MQVGGQADRRQRQQHRQPAGGMQDALAAGRLRALRTRFLQSFLRRRLSLLLPRGRYRGALLDAFLRATIG